VGYKIESEVAITCINSNEKQCIEKGLQSTPHNPRVANCLSDHMSRENTNNSHELGRDEVIQMGDKLLNKNSKI